MTRPDLLSHMDSSTAESLKSFIEVQLPVSKLSKECYKERNSKDSQRLTGTGRWWGRKPLILVRATILGLLLPATDDPQKDREVFLRILTMDEDGLQRRRKKFPLKDAYERLTPSERMKYFQPVTTRLKKEHREDSDLVQAIAFSRMSYDEKLPLTQRPEEIDGPSEESWRVINEHLGTNVSSLPELVQELGKRRFGHVPRVGDAFCGGGSIPFEAARIGCDAYGSDLNPVAAILTWAALNIVGGGPEVADRVRKAQMDVYDAVDRQVTEWGIEHQEEYREQLDKALHDRLTRECPPDFTPGVELLHLAGMSLCLATWEVTCPKTGWRVPILRSLRSDGSPYVLAELIPDQRKKAYRISLRLAASKEEWEKWEVAGTLDPDGNLTHPALIREKSSSVLLKEILGRSIKTAEKKLLLGPLTPVPFAASLPRANAYLYCVEVRCPQTGWMVPLAPSWVIGKSPQTIAHLVPDYINKRYDIEIHSGVSDVEMDQAKESGTVQKGYIVHPILQEMDLPPVSLANIRSAGNGLRLWESDDVAPQADDVFQERLYCIRWEGADGSLWYAAPTEHDFAREENVLAVLRDRFTEWQNKGYIPKCRIEPGDETTRLQRERGWTYWHHLFNPRQLLILGSLAQETAQRNTDSTNLIGCILGIARTADYNAKLARWHPRSAGDKGEQTFSNQALNTLLTYPSRSFSYCDDTFFLKLNACACNGKGTVVTCDARNIQLTADLWITDPPYADAINYHELSEFFLPWQEVGIRTCFADWFTDSKRALAIKGSEESFWKSMVEAYRNLAINMPDNGFQVVMFTHQDASVWADLALILWAAGLEVTAAWCLATETDSALKEGNYVQGTVLLVLRKQLGSASAFLDELYPEVEEEVKAQLNAMLALDDAEDPNFADTDYQLAAYAAALRVLTRYTKFEGRDVAQELNRIRIKGEISPVERLIADAVRVACEYLVPKGIESFVWKTLTPAERFYLKGLDIESHGEFRAGAYQELARGFGLREYKNLQASAEANRVRLRTAAEFGRRDLASRRDLEELAASGKLSNGIRFDACLTRHILFAIAEVAKTNDAQKGRLWLRTELPNYWSDRKTILEILSYLQRIGVTLQHWNEDAKAARLLAGAVENDHA